MKDKHWYIGGKNRMGKDLRRIVILIPVGFILWIIFTFFFSFIEGAGDVCSIDQYWLFEYLFCE